MLSLSHKRSAPGVRALKGCAIAAVITASVAGNAQAAQYFFQPKAEVTVETNTNLQLDPSVGTDQSQGYLGQVGGVFGVATPRSETTVIPRLQYQKYPDYDDSNRLQGDVGFSSLYTSERSVFSVYGGYEHLDGLNAEQSDARFNELNPGQQLSPETGRVRPGATRDSLYVSPSYTFRMTERLGLGASATYQGIDYSPDDATSYVDFDYYKAGVFLKRALSPRADLTFSPYVGRYDARDIDSQTDSVGGAVAFDMRWTETFTGSFDVSYERARFDQTQPVVNKESVNAWGADFSLMRKFEISEIILSLGRAVTPNGGGGLYYSDQLQVQYDRDLSERLRFLSAARYIRDESVSNAIASADRKYAQADVGVEWMMSRTWYLRAGYTYTSQEYEFDADTARNHKFGVSVGYKGLERQRR